MPAYFAYPSDRPWLSMYEGTEHSPSFSHYQSHPINTDSNDRVSRIEDHGRFCVSVYGLQWRYVEPVMGDHNQILSAHHVGLWYQGNIVAYANWEAWENTCWAAVALYGGSAQDPDYGYEEI